MSKSVCEKERERSMCVLSVHVAYTMSYIENSKHVYVYK